MISVPSDWGRARLESLLSRGCFPLIFHPITLVEGLTLWEEEGGEVSLNSGLVERAEDRTSVPISPLLQTTLLPPLASSQLLCPMSLGNTEFAVLRKDVPVSRLPSQVPPAEIG